MELIHRRHQTSKFAQEDVISNMPDIVITNILDRLPLQDAVRTGVLSRNWRFKWTMLTQLVFDENFFNYLSKTKAKNNHVGIISRILLHIRGAITKFVLSIDDCDYPVLNAEDVNNWILFLSRKGINDLTLQNIDGTVLELSTHIFSCLELKHLRLCDCCFRPPPTFRGFPNLLSLELIVKFEENTQLGEFFSGCPLLENLTIDDICNVGKVKLVEITKLRNLKVLSLLLSDLEKTRTTSFSAIFELLGSLPKLQELNLDFGNCMLTEDGAKKRFSTVIPCLKALKLTRMYLNSDMELFCAFELIRSFPNLQTLEITAAHSNWDAGPPPQVDYNTMGLLQLRSVRIECLKGSKNEVRLIKYLLGSSPFLKKIVIHHYLFIAISLDEKLMFARKLLNLYRASPVVKIDLF
ncbi:putative F-box domain, leucine-rich repeat domain superfamily, F-box-like domain superfamily [Helianthus annuus]|nr:putative F-box domain, leucine-rich repeat domain superfamily, F-box-like domain superfamily [Helianthus annuus]